MTENTKAKPFEPLVCSVCGADAGNWRHHDYQAPGKGICITCARWFQRRGIGKAIITARYGVEGINWGPSSTRRP